MFWQAQLRLVHTRTHMLTYVYKSMPLYTCAVLEICFLSSRTYHIISNTKLTRHVQSMS